MAADSDPNVAALPIHIPLSDEEISKAACTAALATLGIDSAAYNIEFVSKFRMVNGHLIGSILITRLTAKS